MVNPLAGLLSGAELAEIDSVMRQAWATVQEWRNPPMIQLRRRGEDGAFANEGDPFQPIRFSLNGEQEPNLPEGASEVKVTGSMRVYADGGNTHPQLRRDDRFRIGTNACRVTFVHEGDNHGTVLVDFQKLESGTWV